MSRGKRGQGTRRIQDFLFFLGLFLVFSGVSVEALSFGIAGAAMATWSKERLRGGHQERVSWVGLMLFLPFFLEQSLRGGVDVARRALMPSMPIEPGFVEWKLNLKSEGGSVAFFAAVISLVPGTLCVRQEEGVLLVHLLVQGEEMLASLGRLERKVGRIFGQEWEEEEEG